MLESFIPETDLERAFVQAINWDVDRARRRYFLNLNRGQWAVGAAQVLCFVRRFAQDENFHDQKAASDEVVKHLNKLNLPQKCSLFKICSEIASSLFEDDDLLVEATGVHLIIWLMVQIALDMPPNSILIVDMLRQLRTFSHRQITLDGLPDLAAIYESLANSWQDRPDEANTLADSQFIKAASWPSTQRSPRADITPVPKTTEEKLQRLHHRLTEASDAHGMRSAPVSAALSNLVEFCVSVGEDSSIDSFLAELNAICADDSVDLGTFDLRRIHSVAAQIHDREKFLFLVEKLERSIFLRRENKLGYDVNTGASLYRLVGLWQATGNLARGEQFCQQVIERASILLKSDDFALRQLKSIHTLIVELLSGKGTSDKWPISLLAKECALPEEFISILSALALDHLSFGGAERASLVLQEMLFFYSDCYSDSARRVGEMLWLLMETDIRNDSSFVLKLIELSELKAFDQHLMRRCDLHINRLANLMRGQVKLLHYIEQAIIVRVNHRGEDLVGLLPLFSILASAHEDLTDHHGLIETLTKVREMSDKPGQEFPTPWLASSIWLAEVHAKNREWNRLHEVFTEIAVHPAVLLSERDVQRLFTIVRLSTAGGALDDAEIAFGWIFGNVTESQVLELNQLVDGFLERYISTSKPERSLTVLKQRLSLKLPFDQYVNRLRMTLARAYVATGDLAGAGAIISQAFADIDRADDKPASEEDLESEPPLLDQPPLPSAPSWEPPDPRWSGPPLLGPSG
jgi:hypothetical protein